MGNMANPSMVVVDFDLTASDNGFVTSKSLPTLGKEGRILAVKVREDSTNDQATAAVLYIADDNLDAAPDDLLVFYESQSMTLSGSATDASWADALAVAAPYSVNAVGDVYVGCNITAGGSGSTTLHVAIIAEVWC